MVDFRGLSSNLSGHYEKQQRLGMKATQAKNHRLNKKFGITKSCIDKEQKKEMKQLEKGRKDMVKFMKKIHVSSGCSVKKEEVKAPQVKEKVNSCSKSAVLEIPDNDNLTEIIDKVVDINHQQKDVFVDGQNKIKMEFVIPSLDSRRVFDLVTESKSVEASPSGIHIGNSRQRDSFTKSYDEKVYEWGGRTREWVQSQNSELIDIDDLQERLKCSQEDRQLIRSMRSHTLPSRGQNDMRSVESLTCKQYEKHESDNSKKFEQQESRQKKRISRTSYAVRHPQNSKIKADRYSMVANFPTEKSTKQQQSIKYRIFEAARRREILGKANEARQDPEESSIVLKDEKWAEYVNQLKERVEMSIFPNKEGTVTSNKDQVEDSQDNSSSLTHRRLLRRSSLPSLTQHNQRRHRSLEKTLSK